jgi:hypothetical protein
MPPFPLATLGIPYHRPYNVRGLQRGTACRTVRAIVENVSFVFLAIDRITKPSFRQQTQSFRNIFRPRLPDYTPGPHLQLLTFKLGPYSHPHQCPDHHITDILTC